ncbi:MAG TPA: tRNA (guanosine(37)-N1)-methyltransferase TrmD [Dehalococcoidia bacterium]|nr:tRNA (guanosine(37)-N1)-methyltransferase TrmD [Dehalococcoidia bacterium]
MRIDVLTLFPRMFEMLNDTGIFQRAINSGLVNINIHNIRDYTHDKHHVVDDYPYGGGAGMLLKPEPIFEAVEDIIMKVNPQESVPIILLTPQGIPFSQSAARRLSKHEHLVFICGHYEGVDERVRQYLVSEEISIGDYVLTGGELAAMVVIDSISRLIPGVLGSEYSPENDSHSFGLLEYPQYTRPAEYRGWSVPEVLLSGNHAQIAKWRRRQAIIRTLERRPELIDKSSLNREEQELIEQTQKAETDKDTRVE